MGVDVPRVSSVSEAMEIGSAREQSQHTLFADLVLKASRLGPVPYAAVWPCEQHALEGVVDAAARGILAPVLVGDGAAMAACARENGLDISGLKVVEASTPAAAVEQAIALVHAGEAHGLIKGSLHTDTLMHGVCSPQSGLQTARRMSHIFLIAAPAYDGLLFVTDAAINIVPDLETKRDIVQNAIDLHLGLGLGTPRVAILSAVETVNPKIQGTLDAACLCKMAERGQITGGVLDGPLAMDNAVDSEAARIKGIVSPVAGRAQILITPDLEAGNMLAKNLIFMAGADSAGIVMGAKVPVLLTSRADSVQARLASAAVGALYARTLRTRPVCTCA